ncbi:MAG: hypothetical protein HYX76_14455, partial [Acidobacteria bacterium]|nr:hypothetical protein [Acidobacteriota bacterium]
TGAIFSRDGKQIFVISGKGLASAANPNGPLPTDPTRRRPRDQYTGSMFRGAVSLVPVPDAPALAAFTKNVYELTPYRDAARLRPAGAPASSPIPREVGGPSPITYVFYVIRENRTYDQVFGDIRSANGDPSLCLFGEDVTPNAHAIVRQFVLLDNFYVNAEVSYNGHPYSTAAYATDAVEKIWPLNYANRGGAGLDEGAGPLRNPYGGLAAPAQGYLWDLCKRHGISVRSYGEYVRSAERGKTEPPYVPRVPGLKGLINTNYPPFDLRIPDSRRVDVWMEEFREYEKTGGLPRLSIIQLGGDHTNYTAPGFQLPAPTWPKTTSRLAGWSKPSAPAVSGSNPQSSWSKTTRRADRTTWTRIDRSG